MNLQIDWQSIIENLRSEHLIELFLSRDPVEIFTNLWVVVPLLVVTGVLYFLNFRKVIAVAAGMCMMWLGFYYGMPYQGEPLNFDNVLVIGGTFVGVAAFYIYIFLIKGD